MKNGNKSQSIELPYNFYGGRSVVYNDEVHIFGGEVNPTGHYKWNKLGWYLVSTLPFDFTEGSVTVYDGKIHILGTSSTNDSTKHYKWNGVTWESVSTLRVGHYNGMGVVLNDKIHMIATASGTGNATKHIILYETGAKDTSLIAKNYYLLENMKVGNKLIESDGEYSIDTNAAFIQYL